jgi:hypothetical protein
VLRFGVTTGLVLGFVCFAQLSPPTGVPKKLWSPIATFSILGCDPTTGEIGGAVQSRVFSVGNGVLWAEAGVGAAATQAVVDVSYGPQALKLLKLGYMPDKIVRLIHESDPDPTPLDGQRRDASSPS